MTPADYSSFRNLLGRSSGFQSVQYRLLEFTLGNKHADVIEVHRRDTQAVPTSSSTVAPSIAMVIIAKLPLAKSCALSSLTSCSSS